MKDVDATEVKSDSTSNTDQSELKEKTIESIRDLVSQSIKYNVDLQGTSREQIHGLDSLSPRPRVRVESQPALFLPRTPETDPTYKRLKVYFFGTPQFTFLSISTRHTVGQLINHVVGLADVDPHVGNCFDKGVPKVISGSSKAPELYEMCLVEDEESGTPHCSGGHLGRDSRIGEFFVNSLAFCRVKEFEEVIDYAKSKLKARIEPKEEVVLDLPPSREVVLRIHCFVANQKTTIPLMVYKNLKLSEVLDKLSEQTGEHKAKECYGFRAYGSNPPRTLSTFEYRPTEFNEFFHYKAMVNSNVFDMNTEVRNLSTSEIELVANMAETVDRNTSERRMKSFATPLPHLQHHDNENKQGEESKKCYVENRASDYEYEEFAVARAQPDKKKLPLWLGVDKAMLSLYKRVKKEEWEKLGESAKAKYMVGTIELGRVGKVESAAYNQKRLYIWYRSDSKGMKRLDLEFQNHEAALRVRDKCKTYFVEHKI
eukprot:TRINITY_DN1098_c0_g1_i1.p1 TRINITY_DN1098_c0_g1~~TRINITY_DN1098_c0_g1_i1.p1  ORF type:complete len:485 (+),score=110.27 TRINITY_DN1098_c0_g1_i1:194-1648(+)